MIITRVIRPVWKNLMPNLPSMTHFTMKWFVVWLVFIVSRQICSAQQPNQVHVYENMADVLLYNDTTPWTDSLCTLQDITWTCNVPDIKIDISKLISGGNLMYNVTLITPVDYEQIRTFTLRLAMQVVCSGYPYQQHLVTIVVIVMDLKDTPPVFKNSTYSVSVPENHLINAAVITGIQAEDPDEQDSVDYEVSFSDEQKRIFQARPQSNPEILDIFLISPLDFEQQHIHRFTIMAIDSVGMNSTCEVVVKVINIQDTPPRFSALQYHGRIKEEAAIGEVVLAVSAIDGDSVFIQDQWEGTGPNEIHYSILDGDVGMFGINSSSGEVITIRELDIDSNPNVTNGLVVLTVMAEELNTSMEPQYGESNSTVLVLIQIEDANDNRPQFNSQSYSGSIRADAAVGELVTIENGGYISVSDIDQAPSNNRFSLHIEQNGHPWDVFKTTIESQYAYASVMIQLSNKSVMDFGDMHIHFQIVAQEYGSISQTFPPTKAEMTVWVKASTTPTPSPAPVKSLPIGASDIIVFIVGFLLLLNIGLTIFICYVMKCGRSSPLRIFSRKYYVSDAKKANRENKDDPYVAVHDAQLESSDAERLESGNQNKAKINTVLKRGKEVNTNVTLGTCTSVLSRAEEQPEAAQLEDKNTPSSHDMSILNEKEQTESSEAQKQTPADISSQMKSQEELMSILHGSLPKTDEVPLKMSVSLDTSLNDNSYTRSNSSSFSDKTTGDGVPLIKSSLAKFKKNKKNSQDIQDLAPSNSDLPFAMLKAKEMGQQKGKNENFTLRPAMKPEQTVSFSPSVEANNEAELHALQTSSPLMSRSNSDIDIYPPASLITQSGFPAVALALPYATGALSINKEPYVGILNPVFETSAQPDSKQTGASPSVTSAPDLTSASTTSSKTDNPVSESASPPLLMPVPAKAQNLPLQTVSSGKQNNANTEGIKDGNNENFPIFAGELLLNPDDDSNKPYNMPQQDSIIDTTKQQKETTSLHPAAAHSTKAASQDFVAAAKSLLTAATQDMKPKEKAESEAVTTSEDKGVNSIW